MNLAVVGLGDAARAVCLATRFVPRCRISAVVDLDEARARNVAFRFGAEAFTDWRRLLVASGSRRPDAVYVAVPHDLHAAMTAELANAGFPVLLEKPVAESLSAALELARQVPVDARIAVNYQYRYDPCAWALVRTALLGTLGPLRYVEVVVPWHRDPSYFTAAAWHASRSRSGGGTLLTQGSHALDIALLAAGGEPVGAAGRIFRLVHTSAEVEDLAFGCVQTRSGVPVTITSSMVSRPADRVRITVYGERGRLTYRGPARARLQARGVRVRSPVVLTELHAYVASLAGFARWAAGGKPHRCPLRSAVPVLAAVDAIYRDAERDTVSIELPEWVTSDEGQ